MVRVGNLVAPSPGGYSSWQSAPGWGDLDQWRVTDPGPLYAGKDGAYPGVATAASPGPPRRINWAWIKSINAFSLPREVTFNPVARQLEW